METDRRRNVYYVIVQPDGKTLHTTEDGLRLYRREAQFGSRTQAEEYLDALVGDRSTPYWLKATVERVEQG